MTTKKLFRRLAILAAVAASATAALGSGGSGTTYYVSPTGSDSNSGSASAPWKTIARVDRATLAAGDSVLFQGGASFADATLTPPASGTAPAPITFGSYGTGQAKLLNANGAVWMAAGTHDVVFTDLDLSSSGSIIFAAAGSGAGTTGITLQRSTVHDSPYSGVGIQPQDSLWTLSGNTFRHLGDSGLLVQGSQVTIDHNAITDTGWNTALNYGKHGIYAKGPNMTISNNDISFDVNGSAISLRYAGARVFDNVIHDTPYAVSIFPQDPANTGTERIYDNRLWNITGWAFYYAGVAENGQPSGLDAIWTSNTTQLSSASEAVNVSEISAAQVTIANSIFTGSYGSAYRGCTSCSEYNNDWYGGSSNLPNGTRDTRANPSLAAAPGLALPSNSALIDAGSTSVSGINYTAACDGLDFHYCGLAPDLGAVESQSGSTPPPPPAATTTTTAAQTGTIAWRGDYSAAFPGWDGVQRVAPDRIAAVPSTSIPGLTPDGNSWARFEVRSGDVLGTSERAQLDNFKNTAGTEGQTAWWAWSTYFDPSYNPQVTSFPMWNIYMQFQHQGFAGQAMLNFEVDAAHKALVLALTNGDPANPTQKVFVLDSAFKAGKRYDHAVNIGWSNDPTKGFVEVWLNGKLVLPLTHIATLYDDDTQAYAIQMLYRQAHTETDVVYQTGLRRGDTAAAVNADFPSVTLPPPPPTTTTVPTTTTTPPPTTTTVPTTTVKPPTTTTTTTTATPPPPPAPVASISWVGDSLAKYAAVQRKAADRIAPATSPVGDEGSWFRYEVRSGDKLGTDPAERAELVASAQDTHGGEGTSAWWSWSTYFDPSYKPQVTSQPLWNAYTLFQPSASAGPAMLSFEVDSAHKALVLVVSNGDPARPTQRRFTLDPRFKAGKRYDQALNVGWSSSSSKGFIQVTLNGKVVVPLTHIATLYNTKAPATVVQGLYRQAHKETDVVYQSALRRGGSYAAVVGTSSTRR